MILKNSHKMQLTFGSYLNTSYLKFFKNKFDLK